MIVGLPGNVNAKRFTSALRYACINWPEHLAKAHHAADSHGVVQVRDNLNTFIRSHLHSWSKAVKVFSEMFIYSSVSSMEVVQDWAVRDHHYGSSHNFL